MKTCPRCRKKFRSDVRYVQHKCPGPIVSKGFRCSECGSTQPSERFLELHGEKTGHQIVGTNTGARRLKKPRVGGTPDGAWG